MRLTSRLFWVLVSASMPAARLIAQDYDGDPPARVARLSYVSGAVSFRPADVDDWTTATLNYPITTGDHLWADHGARAELHIGSTAVRMGGETALSVLVIDDRRVQLRMTQGALQVRVRDLDDDDVFEIDTPDGAVTLLRPGSYRIDVDESGERATVTVRSGAAEVSTRRSTFAVRAGESATIVGSDDPRYDRYAAIPMDAWEDWCLVRDRREDHVVSVRYVSREMIGYEDLDAYGVWRVEAGYGPVWVPTHVAAGWAPYRYGHWAWVRPWGWTWIDDAPWGFAPFHYGRWAYVRGHWVWVPGTIVRRPVYAPALVVFVGGPGWSISVAAGHGVG
ncbi:MAG: FecR domain-containing protein, partial [Gemmatimonadaceae bacterium]|nr:FecR domain-containing protein [Gemmatimonadaceae bacterium]